MVEPAVVLREAPEAAEAADAARRQLASRFLGDVVASWKREHGALSDDELAAARALVQG